MYLSKPQQRMIKRLQSGNYIIGCLRGWYLKRPDGQYGYSSKANNNTIDALIAKGILIESGELRKASYKVIISAGFTTLL